MDIDKIINTIMYGNNYECFTYKNINIVYGSINKINECFKDNRESIFIYWDYNKIVVTPILHGLTSYNLEWFLNEVPKTESDMYTLIKATTFNKNIKEWIIYSLDIIIELKNQKSLTYFDIYTDMFQRKKIGRNQGSKANLHKSLSNELKLLKNTLVSSKSMRTNNINVHELLQLENFLYSKNTRVVDSEYVVEVSFLYNKKEFIFGIGINRDYMKALNIALYEILERYSSINNQKFIKGTIAEFTKNRVSFMNPIDYFKKRKNKLNIDNEKLISWCLAYDLGAQNNIYIPKDLLVYRQEADFINSSSNGHALGNSIIEATIFAIYEMVERDLFLNYWSNKNSPLNINLASIRNKEINTLINKIEKKGYRVSIFEMLNNSLISAYWVYVEGFNNNKFATYSTAAAHMNNVIAILDALKECYFALFSYDNTVVENKKKSLTMDEIDIQEVEDHPIYYATDERKIKFQFLNKKQKYNFNEDKEISIELVKYFKELTQYVNNEYGGVYLNLNSNDLCENFGLKCIKVFLEDAHEMYFGFKNQNLNFNRLNKHDIDIHPFP